MKLRKVLSLIMALAMIMTASTAFAFSDVTVDDDAYEAITGLSALKILTGYEDGTFLPEGKITRAEFATIIMRTLGMDVSSKVNTVFADVTSEHWASGAIQEAYGAGIVNGRSETVFDPEAEVTYEEATKMIVCAMGYQKKAESMVKEGQNPYPTAYNLIANQKGITSGVAKTAGGASRATVAQLVWNALPVNLMDQTSYGSEAKFEEIKDQSLLYTKLSAVLLDAKIEKLVLDPDTKTVDFVASSIDLDDVAEKAEDFKATDFANIKKGACDLAGLQGLTVKALVDVSDKNDPVLIAVFPSSSNKTLEIDPKLFKEIDSSNRIVYYKSEDANTANTSSKVDSSLAIYVNLVKYTGSLADATNMGTSYNPGNSLYRFVDTDNDGYYDTLFIDNYASFVVKKVNVEDYAIYPDTSSSIYNSSKNFASMGKDYDYSLVLDPEDDKIAWSLKDDSGKDIELSDINAGDVITYAMSYDSGNYYYDITVCKSSAVTGTISSIKTKKSKVNSSNTYVYYEIDGNTYMLNKADSASNPALEAGASGTFQITADGKIIAVQLDATARNFAIGITAGSSDSTFDKGVKVQLMKADGSIEAIAVTDDFYVNDVKLNATATDLDGESGTTYNSVSDLADALKGKPIMYELKSTGEIKNIYVGNSAINGKDEDYKVVEGSAVYAQSSEKLGSSVYFNDNSAVVAAAKNKALNAKGTYSLISKESFVDETSYSFIGVVDENKEAVILLIKDFEIVPLYSSTPMYVTGLSTVSVDGYKRTQVEGYVANELVSYTLAETDDLTPIDSLGKGTGIAEGDAIQFTLNGSEEINSYRHIVKVKDGKAYFLISDNMATGEDSKDEGIAKIVEYSLTEQSSVPTTAPGIYGNSYATYHAGHAASPAVDYKINGYGAFGRVQRVANKTVGIFYDLSNSELTENYIDVVGDANAPVFVASEAYSDGYAIKSLDSIRSYKDTDSLAKSDDVVYIYRYDGEVVFQYAIDSLANNK